MPRERSPSRRSITSATVIPIATDGHSGATPSDNADNAGTPDYTAETEQDTVVVHDSPTQVAGDNDPDSVMTPTEVHTEDSQRQSSPPKHAPLPVSQRIPMSVELTHRGSFKLVNNYKALATSFRQLQPFARRPDGTYPASITCVMCATGKPTSVFFPCQHMCVCSKCIQSNDMSPDCSMHLERCVCPVCSADIGLILPHTGTEEEAYWKWVLATQHCLPSQFTRDFKSAGGRIGDTSVEMDTMGTIPRRRASDTTKPNQTPSKLTKQRSWAPTLSRRESAYNVASPTKRENCQIL